MSKVKQISVYGANGWSQPYDIGVNAENIEGGILDSQITFGSDSSSALQTRLNGLDSRIQGTEDLVGSLNTSVGSLNTSVGNLNTSVGNLSQPATTSSNGLMSAEDKIKLSTPIFQIREHTFSYSIGAYNPATSTSGQLRRVVNVTTNGEWTPFGVSEYRPGSPVVLTRAIEVFPSGFAFNLKNISSIAIDEASYTAELVFIRTDCVTTSGSGITIS